MMKRTPKIRATPKSGVTEAGAVPNALSSEGAAPQRHDDMHKKRTLVLSVPTRLEGLAAVLLALAALVFLGMSAHALYQFPTPDSYRWYGDETIAWMLLGWKHMIAHGQLTVPIALGSTLIHPPGLLLGSPWLTAFVYGLPEILMPPQFDPVSIGRTVSFIVALATIVLIGWAGFRLKWTASITILVIALLAALRAFTFASHSARYDIITGFAVLAFVIFFAIRVGERFWERPRRDANFAFWFGLTWVLLAITVSPHADALLLLPAILVAWYFGLLDKIRNVLSLFAGAIIGIALLAILYLAINHHLDLMGIAAGGNRAGGYLQHLPVMKLFSWPAQRHQLGVKLFYLWREAPPFTIILPLIAASEFLLLLRRQCHPVTLFLTICLACVLAGAAFLQSALPYYLSHFLPLAAATFGAHLHEWTRDEAPSSMWLRPIVAILSLVIIAEIFGLWLPELSNAGRMGKRLDEANTAAVEAAMEFASRTWPPGTGHPVVLAQAPAVHELLRDTSLRVMSEAFLFFPLHPGAPVDSVIREQHVNYILDYNKPITAEYDRVVHSEQPVFQRVGQLLDRTVDYFHDTASELDTLTMYEVDTTR